MKKDYNKLAKDIVANIGGEENVISLTHCITRLRFKLKDEEKANKDVLSELNGVLKVLQSGGQYQIVIGNDVTDVFNAIMNNGDTQVIEEVEGNKEENTTEKRKVSAVLIDIVSSIFMPFMGAFTGCGLLKGFLVLFTTIGVLNKDSSTYSLLYAASDSIFYFLPIFLAYTAGKKFGAKPFMSMVIACTMVYPSIGTMFSSKEAISFIGIPVQLIRYTSSVLPIIVACFFQAKFEKLCDKFIPKLLRGIFTPLLVLIVVIPISFIVIGPITGAVGDILADGTQVLLNFAPAIAGFLFAALWPVMIIFGVHWAFIPIVMNNYAVLGYDNLLPLTVGCNFGIAAACFAIFLKTHNKELKETAAPATISALIGGVTEPAIYGVLLKFKLPFIIVCIANGIGGAICGFFHVTRTAQMTVNVLTLPAVYAMYGQWAIVSVAISTIVSFALVFMFVNKEINKEK
ncbi:MAG: PTS transporter subunit EIIC [Fusobacteriaceae bacterium]|nr:PTS transporter subunit EIIC [Fusobacteriaceae bacterium]MBN2838363.1 PTS transporter subunit EIIC [Fusobacteriaceae bacterium]